MINMQPKSSVAIDKSSVNIACNTCQAPAYPLTSSGDDDGEPSDEEDMGGDYECGESEAACSDDEAVEPDGMEDIPDALNPTEEFIGGLLSSMSLIISHEMCSGRTPLKKWQHQRR